MKWILLLATLAMSNVVCAAGVAISVGGPDGNVFTPQFVTIDPGDSVTFINKGGFHNAVADDGSFRCARGCDGDGNGGNGGASSQLWIASITLTTPGQHGYFCEIHGAPGQGMYGVITVRGTVATPAEAVPTGGKMLLAILAAGIVATALFAVARKRRS